MKKIKDYTFIILGHIFLTLGIIGLILPIMPGTIFLVLSAGFYFRGSKKLYKWLLSLKFLGNYIKQYRKKEKKKL